MSLNKFNNEEKGYALKLGVGADEMKCNDLEVVDVLSLGGVPFEGVPTFTSIIANYTTSNGASVSVPTQEIRAFRSGNFLYLCDNVSVEMDASGTNNSFQIEFDLPSYVPLSGVSRSKTSGAGGAVGLIYTVLKVNSSYSQGSGRLSLEFVKSNGTNFSSADILDCSWDVVLDLGI